MKVETSITLHLSKEESDALKKLLGQHSKASKIEFGLSPEQAQIISEIWDLLPHPEDE